jgi:hypothetical protein
MNTHKCYEIPYNVTLNQKLFQLLLTISFLVTKINNDNYPKYFSMAKFCAIHLSDYHDSQKQNAMSTWFTVICI